MASSFFLDITFDIWRITLAANLGIIFQICKLLGKKQLRVIAVVVLDVTAYQLQHHVNYFHNT